MKRPYVAAALLVAGIVLLIWGLQQSNSFASDVSRTFTGSPTDESMWLIVGGAVLTVLGLVGFFGGRKKLTI
jgi:hypothetical protein